MNRYNCILVISLFLFGCATSEQHLENVQHESMEIANQFENNSERVSATPYPDVIELNWSASIKGSSFEWDGKDLFVQRRGEKKQGIFSQLARNNFLSASKEITVSGCEFSHYFSLLSVVGSIVSFEHETGVICGIPVSDWRFSSLELDKAGEFIYPTQEKSAKKEANGLPSKIVSLLELFSDDEITAALLANQRISQEISKAIAKGNLTETPLNLREFNMYFTKRDYEKFGSYLFFDEDYLTRFVFHHLSGDKVVVRISLTPTSGSSRSAVREHIEILLPVPKTLRSSLLRADSGKEGFLMKDAPKHVGTSAAKFEFSGK